MKIRCSALTNFKKLLPLFEFFVLQPRDGRNGNATFLGDDTHGFRKGNFLGQHDECEDVASSTATKTGKNWFFSVDGKRRCFFRMKRTQPFECAPCAFKANIIRNHSD